MDNLRKYGRLPFNAVVVHGGPGAPGEMAPVARELSSAVGVLEPLQKATTVEGQVDELRAIMEKYASIPVTLIGFSWGAWLSYIFTSSHPLLVRKLILVSSGPFDDRYAGEILAIRLSRLDEKKRLEVISLLNTLNSPPSIKDGTLARFGELMSEADAYDLLPHESEILEYSPHIYRRVWEQADRLRISGELLKMGEKIECPVVAIHGDYDPHPASGVKEPLSRVIRDFRFILLKKCGHYPWYERHARDRFYKILRDEIGLSSKGKEAGLKRF